MLKNGPGLRAWRRRCGVRSRWAPARRTATMAAAARGCSVAASSRAVSPPRPSPLVRPGRHRPPRNRHACTPSFIELHGIHPMTRRALSGWPEVAAWAVGRCWPSRTSAPAPRRRISHRMAGPARRYSPRHRISFDSRNKGSRVPGLPITMRWMTWRAIFVGSYETAAQWRPRSTS